MNDAHEEFRTVEMLLERLDVFACVLLGAHQSIYTRNATRKIRESLPAITQLCDILEQLNKFTSLLVAVGRRRVARTALDNTHTRGPYVHDMLLLRPRILCAAATAAIVTNKSERPKITIKMPYVWVRAFLPEAHTHLSPHYLQCAMFAAAGQDLRVAPLAGQRRCHIIIFLVFATSVRSDPTTRNWRASRADRAENM